MAKIVNSSQQIIAGVQFPRGVYSRVIAFSFPLNGAGNIDGWDITGIVAQNVWLLNVMLRVVHEGGASAASFNWRIFTTTTVPKTGQEVAVDADTVIDSRSVGVPYIWDAGSDVQYSWDMNRLFTGTGRRFGIWAQNNGLKLMWVFGSFTISEG